MSLPQHRGLSGGTRVPARDPFDCGPADNRHAHELPLLELRRTAGGSGILLGLIKLGLTVVVLLVLSGSLYWAISISNVWRVNIYTGYRRFQVQLLNDLSDIGELSLGSTRLKELEFCSPEYEDYVPCYNVSEDADMGDRNAVVHYERRCAQRLDEELGCLIMSPRDYRIPLRWPSGRDFIWKENVKITVEEFSSGT